MRNLFITLSLLITLSFLQAQSVSYQIYNNGNVFSNEEKILNAFEVPKGNLFIVKNKEGVFFKLFDSDFKLLKTTPLTSDLADYKTLTIDRVYKLKDKIIGEFWGGRLNIDLPTVPHKYVVFEYDLTGNFIKHIDMPELKANAFQDLYFSSDSNLILYWATPYMMKANYVKQVSDLKEDERFISYIIYNSNFEVIRKEDLQLNNLKIEKDQYLNIHDVKILKNGGIKFCYSFRQKNGTPYEKNTCNVSFMTYEFENKRFKNFNTTPIISEKYKDSPEFISLTDSMKFIAKYDNKYLIYDTKDNAKTAKQVKPTVDVKPFHIYGNKNGNFLVEDSYLDMKVCFINNDYLVKEYEMEKYATNKYTLNNTSKFIENNRFYMFYIHQNKSNKKFDYVFALFNEKGELTKKTIQFNEDLYLNDLSDFYKIGENKYLTQLYLKNKYVIIDIKY